MLHVRISAVGRSQERSLTRPSYLLRNQLEDGTWFVRMEISSMRAPILDIHGLNG